MISSQPTSQDFFACPDCDLLINQKQIQAGHSLYCPRCGCLLLKRSAQSIEKTLALSITGILLFFPSLLLPLLKFDAFGFSDSGSLLQSIVQLFAVKYYFVGVLVALFAAIFPLMILSLTFIISLQLHKKISSRWTSCYFRFYLNLNEWAMLEVYLLGILVAIIKMLPIANITYFPGFFCFIIMAILPVWIAATLDKVWFWEKIEELKPNNVQEKTPSIVEISLHHKTNASTQGLLLCQSCRKLLTKQLDGTKCPRCQGKLRLRKPRSTSRTWALILTTSILLFPANILPIMEVDFLGEATRSTILDGIVYFFEDGDYFIGAVILIASILVPLFKVIGLVILLAGRRQTEIALRAKTKLYRFITFIGRWSMLDIFVIALLVALVDFGFVSSTRPAPGSYWFCLVVTVTMFAAITFDPRLMWDKAHTNNS